MAHGTNQLVESLRSVPALVESLKRDPARLLTNLAKCDQGQAAIRAGAQLISEIITGCTSSAPAQRKPSAPLPAQGLEISSPITPQGRELLSETGASLSVGIVGITSLAVITGSVALLGTVSIVALNRRSD
jgi:hypothetical protein